MGNDFTHRLPPYSRRCTIDRVRRYKKGGSFGGLGGWPLFKVASYEVISVNSNHNYYIFFSGQSDLAILVSSTDNFFLFFKSSTYK